MVISQDKIINDLVALTRFLAYLNKPWFQGNFKTKRQKSFYLPIPITSFLDKFGDF